MPLMAVMTGTGQEYRLVVHQSRLLHEHNRFQAGAFAPACYFFKNFDILLLTNIKHSI
ncbi:MAG: hypothetical protein WC483_06865 [Candidatus Paceibacterota bacterium]